SVEVTHPLPEAEVARIFSDKDAYLHAYQADWLPWLDALKQTWPSPRPDLAGRLAAWWEPLLAHAPHLRAAIGANALLRCGRESVLVDFPQGTVRPYRGEAFGFSFDLPGPLVEQVVENRAVDWSNSLFLSCRFRAWRAGDFNEYL